MVLKALLLFQLATAFFDNLAISVETKHGSFGFEAFRLTSADGNCQLSVHIRNKTDSGWVAPLRFLATISAVDGDNHSYTLGVPIVLAEDFPWNTGTSDAVGRCPAFLPALKISELHLSLVEGKTLDESIAAREQAQRAAIERRRLSLAKAPKLFGPAVIAADSKCLDETITALAKDGLEKRKALAELARYSCIFLAAEGAPVKINASGSGKTNVTVLDGPGTGKSGWVASSWISGPNSAVKP